MRKEQINALRTCIEVLNDRISTETEAAASLEEDLLKNRSKNKAITQKYLDETRSIVNNLSDTITVLYEMIRHE